LDTLKGNIFGKQNVILSSGNHRRQRGFCDSKGCRS
jgi:hypothetical protein